MIINNSYGTAVTREANFGPSLHLLPYFRYLQKYGTVKLLFLQIELKVEEPPLIGLIYVPPHLLYTVPPVPLQCILYTFTLRLESASYCRVRLLNDT